MLFNSFGRSFLAVAIVGCVANAVRADMQFVPLPDALPQTAPVVSIKPGCEDRTAVIALLSRLRASAGGDEATFRHVDFKGARYAIFSPKKAGVPLSTLAGCLSTYMGTEKDAQRIGLLVPGNDTPIGVMIYTPGLGFYGDPRAWSPLGKH